MDGLTLSAIAIVVIYLGLFIGSFFFNVCKTILKIFALVSLVLFLVLGIFGYFVYKDVMEFQQRFKEERNTFLLYDNNNIAAGFAQQNGNFSLLTNDELVVARQAYKTNAFESLKGNYKIIIVNAAIFNQSETVDLDKIVNIPGIRLGTRTNKDLLEFINGKNIQVMGYEIKHEEFGNSAFALMLSSSLEKNGPGFMIHGLKDGNIIIWRETITFKVIKYIPDSMINKAESLVKKEV